MKITTLLENTSCRDDLFPEHGLSLYLETGEYRILFDMGQTDAFARNAEKLGIDLSQVDLAVLSHGHYDHGGGLETFLQINAKAPVYIHETAFGAHYNGTEKYIGLNPALRESSRLIFTKGVQWIAPGIRLLDCNDLGWKTESFGLNRIEGDNLIPDGFSHEQYLEITENGRRILISGCSHKGIGNIAAFFHPDVLVGGFHLNKVEDTDALRSIARKLLALKSIYYTGHCTGNMQLAVMKEILGNRLQPIATGYCFEA